MPLESYARNLRSIFDTLKALQPRAKLLFSTSTPVPLGDGGGSRTEAHVQQYNAAALAALHWDAKHGIGLTRGAEQ